MDATAFLTAKCAPEAILQWIVALDTYPRWMSLVHSATADVDESDVWHIELRAAVGPITRSKRLRMRRTVYERFDRHVRFEREEVDGRLHSSWVLDARVTPVDGSSSELTMSLHYGGTLWSGGLLERVLAEHIARGQQRLTELIAAMP
jgi:hypothetical protein